MDVGAYFRDIFLNEWESFMEGLPNVIVNELEIHQATGMIKAGTYGRGLWESPIHMIEPIANFFADKTLIPEGCAINFTSISSGPPETHLWTFEGGIPETSTEKDPSGIVYETDGIYGVTLVVINELGSDTLVKEDYITVSNTLLPMTDFTASDSILCSSESIVYFYDQTLYCPTSFLWEITPWTFEFIEGTDETSQNPAVNFLEPTNYSVSLTATNSNGATTLIRDNYIKIGGLVLPYSQAFEVDEITESGWTVINSDNKKTWEIAEVGGSTGTRAAMMNFYNYNTTPGVRDQLISPPFNLEGIENAHLVFKHAYAKRYVPITDSLIVYISDDCGNSWIRIFEDGDDGNGSFATHVLTTDEFFPATEEDWCGAGYGASCVSLDISAWVGIQDVKIMFESYHYLGNNLFIDDVQVYTTVNIDENTLDNTSFQVFPNPAQNKVNLLFTPVDSEISIKLMNLQGQIILNNVKPGISGQIQIDLNNIARGIYLLEVRDQQKKHIEKLIIN